jgi:hypothetical protein
VLESGTDAVHHVIERRQRQVRQLFFTQFLAIDAPPD